MPPNINSALVMFHLLQFREHLCQQVIMVLIALISRLPLTIVETITHLSIILLMVIFIWVILPIMEIVLLHYLLTWYQVPVIIPHREQHPTESLLFNNMDIVIIIAVPISIFKSNYMNLPIKYSSIMVRDLRQCRLLHITLILKDQV